MNNTVIEETQDTFVVEEENKQNIENEEANFDLYKLKVNQKIYLVFKNVIDKLLALIAIIVLSPILIILSLAVKCSSKGPVFFKQERI